MPTGNVSGVLIRTPPGEISMAETLWSRFSTRHSTSRVEGRRVCSRRSSRPPSLLRPEPGMRPFRPVIRLLNRPLNLR